jgi:hypothetical protein
MNSYLKCSGLAVLGLVGIWPVGLEAQSGFPDDGVRIVQVRPATETAQQKKRVVVLTDIEADPDDAQSLVRLLLYSNDVDIEALIATTSVHQKQRVAPESIRKIVDAYGKVQPNLLKHEKGFPTAQSLLALVRHGVPLYGMQGVGDGKDSEGSEFLIRVLEKPDPRPVWVTVWGGPNCLAQALWKIQKSKPAAEAEKLYARLRVHTISDQDDSGPWIRRTFPSVFYILSNSWGGMSQAAPGSNVEVVSPAWLAANIQQGHGPLGAQYPDIAYGMEGDTPSYLGLIRNGLNEMEHPNWGGWGGRFEFFLPTPGQQQGGRGPGQPGSPGGNPATPAAGGPPVSGANTGRGAAGAQSGMAGMRSLDPETHPIWASVNDTFSPASMQRRSMGGGAAPNNETYATNQVTVWRWRTEFQNDFAARMDWTTKAYAEANHPPVVKLSHPDEFSVKSGQFFRLDADGSYDPDGDSLSYFWFQYQEVGTYKERAGFGSLSPNLYNVHTIRAPVVTSPQTVHYILKVTDKGTPALTRYKRVVVTFVP